MIRLHIIQREYPYDKSDKDYTIHMISSDFIPREGELITIDDALDGPDGSVGSYEVKSIQYIFKVNQTYHGHNELDHVKIYI